MSNNFKKLVFFALIVGITLLAYLYMIKPANKALADQQARLQQKNAKLAEFEKAAAAARDMNAQLEQLQKAVEFFESKLPSSSEIHKVLEQVTVIAQKNGLTPKTIKTLVKKYNSGYIEQPLNMGLEGNFNDFYSFLLDLERLPRIMKIRMLTLKKQKELEGQVDADFIVSIFFQPAS